jgi:protein-tyrosine phosphatase
MGNICRSPTAEAVFKQLVEGSGLGDRIQSDSAGTHDYHIGEPPDDRAQLAARRRGYDLSALRARQVRREDFTAFDYVLAMDSNNMQLLARSCPAEHRSKLFLLMQFSEQPGPDVPDPYYGGPQGFEQVLDMVEEAARGLLRRIRETLG